MRQVIWYLPVKRRVFTSEEGLEFCEPPPKFVWPTDGRKIIAKKMIASLIATMINKLPSLLIFWFVCVPFRLVEAGLLAKGPSWGTKFPQLPPELISCSVILADKDVETHLRNRVKNLWEVRSVQAANCLHCVVESFEEKLASKR